MRDNTYMIGNKFAEGNGPNSTSFKKGLEPWNKGLKGIHLSPSSQFKPGVPSGRAVPIGTVRTRGGGHSKGMRQHIKTEAGWTEYAKWLWIQEYGPLLPGDVVHHLNGDRLADTLDNLIALPRSVHPTIHSRWGIKQPTPEQMRLFKERYQRPADGLQLQTMLLG